MTSRTDGLRHRLLWLWRLGAGPLPGWICLLGAFLLVGAYGAVQGNAGGYLKFLGPSVAAIALNACTWLAAMLFGRTRQLRISWLAYVALWLAFCAAIATWPSWGHDMGIIMMYSTYSLGFPAVLVMWLLPGGPLPRLPWGLQGAEVVIDPLIAFGLAYLQAFVLLPLLFKWRARAVARHAEDAARPGVAG